MKCLYACAWSFGKSVSQSESIFTAKKPVWDQCCNCHPLIWCSLSVLPLSPSVSLWSSSLLSSLRKTPSLPGPECKCFIFHPPTSPLCSTGHLAVIFQHLKAIIPKYECSPTDVSRHSQDIFLPSSSSLPHGQKQKEEKSRCLVSVDQRTYNSLLHGCVEAHVHTRTRWYAFVCAGACTEKNNTHTHTHKLFTSHAHTIKSVRWSPIKDENKPASGRCPLRKSTVAIVELWNHGNWLAEACGAAAARHGGV